MSGAADEAVERPAWIRSADPAVPGELARWIRAPTGEEPPGPDALVEAAVDALRRSLQPAGRPREGAFHLLAADALVTWACEAALDAADPVERCAEVARHVVRGRETDGGGAADRGGPGAGDEGRGEEGLASAEGGAGA